MSRKWRADMEIIKALRNCNADECHCGECPYEPKYVGSTGCISSLIGAAADELERLQEGYDNAIADARYRVEQVRELQAENTDLRIQLSESQRREQAAVEDINSVRMCHTCKHFLREFGMGGIECKMPCATIRHENFEWRGPQAGKGEAE
jgi:hypothetical protein